MGIIAWITAHVGVVVTLLGALHIILGTINELTHNQTVNGLDGLIANIIKTLGGLGSQQLPKS